MENLITITVSFISSEDDNDKDRTRNSKSDNIEIMSSNEADEVIKKLFDSLEVVSLSSIMFSYCTNNAIK